MLDKAVYVSMFVVTNLLQNFHKYAEKRVKRTPYAKPYFKTSLLRRSGF